MQHKNCSIVADLQFTMTAYQT